MEYGEVVSQLVCVKNRYSMRFTPYIVEIHCRAFVSISMKDIHRIRVDDRVCEIYTTKACITLYRQTTVIDVDMTI